MGLKLDNDNKLNFGNVKFEMLMEHPVGLILKGSYMQTVLLLSFIKIGEIGEGLGMDDDIQGDLVE